MPQGGRPIRSKNPCQICDGPTYEIWHRDGHGGNTLLETHCNQCGAAWDGEGNPRYQPHNANLLRTINKEFERIMPLYIHKEA